MKIVQQNQYNQGIGKYKLLSSNAGVGSIVTTKMGYYALISDIMQWEFIKKANISIEKERTKETDKIKLLKNIDTEFERTLGLTRVDDQRFVDFLVQNQALTNLFCLAAVSHLSLNENYNNVNTKSNPILAKLGLKANDFVIPATHFPKWFIGSGGELKEYKDWLKLWIDKGQHSNEFAPPRDANKPLMNKDKEVIRIKTKIFAETDNVTTTKGSYQITETGDFIGKVKTCNGCSFLDIEFQEIKKQIDYKNFDTLKPKIKLNKNNSIKETTNHSYLYIFIVLFILIIFLYKLKKR